MGPRKNRLKIGAALAALATLSAAACSSGNSGNSAGPTFDGKKMETTLVYANTGGSIEKTFMDCQVYPFEKAYPGVTVKYDVATAPATTLAQIAAEKSNPTIDLFYGDETTEYEGLQSNLFESVPYSAIPNAANLPASVRDYRQPGDDAGIPVGTELSGIAYNTTIFKEKGWQPPTSWTDLLNPRYKGHIGMSPLTNANPEGFVASLANIYGVPYSNMNSVFEKIKAIDANNLIYASAPLLDTGFENGSVWIADDVAIRAYAAKVAGEPEGFVQPKEGIVQFPQFMDIVRNAPDLTTAEAFANFVLQPSVQKCVSEQVGYGSVLPSVDNSLPSALKLYAVPTGGKTSPINWLSLEKNLPTWLKEAAWLT